MFIELMIRQSLFVDVIMRKKFGTLRVSSQRVINSTSLNMRKARSVISSKLPIGVGTMYSLGIILYYKG